MQHKLLGSDPHGFWNQKSSCQGDKVNTYQNTLSHSHALPSVTQRVSGHAHLITKTKMARAGPSRTQRSQRATQASQSQSQRPVRGSRRAAVEEDEDEDESAGDDGDQDMDIDGTQARLADADAVSSSHLG